MSPVYRDEFQPGLTWSEPGWDTRARQAKIWRESCDVLSFCWLG